MLLDPQKIPVRERLILTGLYMSKYDEPGLKKLGFESFVEAFNVIGFALGQKPASIKNYRDEFDPFFPNKRQGWHKRPARDYCLKVLTEYKRLDLETFAGLIRSFTGYDESAWSQFQPEQKKGERVFSFASRLTTGLAAEHYFVSVQPILPEFHGCTVENTTLLGCGYDFRLQPSPTAEFLAVEVKGLKERSGAISLTPKEYETATRLNERFFLFVVKNFRESPFHEVFPNPLASGLSFAKKERTSVQVSWLASV